MAKTKKIGPPDVVTHYWDEEIIFKWNDGRRVIAPRNDWKSALRAILEPAKEPTAEVTVYILGKTPLLMNQFSPTFLANYKILNLEKTHD